MTDDAEPAGDPDPGVEIPMDDADDDDLPPALHFLAITADAGGTLSAPPDAWSFGTQSCVAPCSGAKNVELNGDQAGSEKLFFVQLVFDNRSGDMRGQSSTGLWLRWNAIDQWTPDVTGDPRDPIAPPPLGTNKLENPSFAAGSMTHWFVAASGDVTCASAGTCSYKVEQVSPDPGGYSVHITTDAAHPGGVQIGAYFGAAAGSTYLVSVWSTGSGGSLHEEHDSTGTKTVTVLPTQGWVQTFCKFVPVAPSGGALMLKAYPLASFNVTNFYAGVVDASYPAPACKLQY